MSSCEEMDVRASAIFAARNLGYEKLKDLQMNVTVSFVTGNDVFAVQFFPLVLEKVYGYAYLPGMFDHLLQPEEPLIVIVVTSLTAIMEDQAGSYPVNIILLCRSDHVIIFCP